MTLLLNLYLGHLLGDFVLQPGWLVMAKRRGINGLLVHTGIIGVCTALILVGELGSLWNIVLMAMAAHLGIEVITIRMRSLKRLSGLSVFLIDQGLHILSLVVIVWFVAPIAPVDTITTFGFVVDPAVVALADGLIAVSFMGAIIIFEVTNAVGPDSWNRHILPYDMPRILGMLERGIALLLGVLVNPVVMVAAFAPRVIYAFRQEPDARARQMVAATAGLIVCIVGWAFVVYTAAVARGGP
jgi:hypothetical protein